MEEEDWKNFTISVEDCEKWAAKLERLSNKFGNQGDIDNAKLMHLCSVLMQKLAFDVVADELGGVFGPVKGGEC